MPVDFEYELFKFEYIIIITIIIYIYCFFYARNKHHRIEKNKYIYKIVEIK